MSTISNISRRMDPEFIRDEAGVTNHFGYDFTSADEMTIVYPVENFDAVQAVLANYDALFLERRLKPAAIGMIANLRREKMQRVTIGGVTIQLDTATEAHLASAVIGLERNPSVTGIDWELAPGVFQTLPRDVVFAIGDGAFMHVQGCFTYARALTTQVQACTTAGELEAIDLNAGWPNE